MRALATFATLAALAVTTAAMAAADPLSSLSFHDGKDRTLASFSGQTLVVVAMTGKC
jgi:hypothetical protein